jgi:hypothetical protein
MGTSVGTVPGVSRGEPRASIGAPPRPAADAERAARRALRAQIARLEAELSAALLEVFTMRGEPWAPPPAGDGTGPRLLDLGELERVRDELAHRLAGAREAIGRSRTVQEDALRRLEAMQLQPGHHRLRRISDRELGRPGCGVWHVGPRLGLLGMLMGWWEVKHSSGCPLAGAPR